MAEGITVALDCTGGDDGEAPNVAGAVQAARDFGITVTLIGKPERINRELAKHQIGGLNLPIIEAPDEVEMDEHPALAVRRKPNASINIAMKEVKEGRAAAMVSAGNSGATMVAALFHLGRIPGIDRPAIGAIMPTLTNDMLLIDAGANTEVHPDYLVQFAQMGSIYMANVRGVTRPRIGLLSSGEEETKGTKIVQEANQLLKATAGLNFIGNVEGKDLPQGACDVCVTDGFTGNVALKTAEGTAALLTTILRSELTKTLPRKLAAAVLRPAFRTLRDKLDPSREGGALLFGVDGVAIIAHGHSNARAIRNAIRVGKECVEGKAVEAIRALHADTT